MRISRTSIIAIASAAVLAVLVGVLCACVSVGQGHASNGDPYLSTIEFTLPVSDISKDVLVETSNDMLGPVFEGDYQAYLAGIRAQERSEREAKRAEEAAKAASEQGAHSTASVDTGNIVQVVTSVELPPIPAPAPIETIDPETGEVTLAPAPIEDISLPGNYRTLTNSAFAGKSTKEKVDLIGAMARQDMRESGILASVTAAQAILESGWMTSGLAQRNALFGIKACVSENNWANSTWTGTAVDMQTKEEYAPGEITTVTAAFRTYPNIWSSIKDHSAYLINAKKGTAARYPGIASIRDPRTAITVIKNGGYATDSGYVDKIMQIINQYNLARFDS